MKLTGSYKIPTDKQTVWEALNNPDILQKCIPGCEEFKKNSDTSFTATATNKIGPFNASFTGDVELQDLNPPNSYTLVGQGDARSRTRNYEIYCRIGHRWLSRLFRLR